MSCTFAWMLLGQPRPEDLPRLTRKQIIEAAKKMADYTWVCRKEHLRADCVSGYQSDWTENQRVVGIPYDWGGMDLVDEFAGKLEKGQAAGSHSRDGVTNCTAGTDCSGFVSRCWGQNRKYSTRSIREIAGRPRYNWFTDMKPGDALDYPGKHIVLFAGYNADGTINVYEASGSAGRVVFRKATWSRFKGYYPLQYKMVTED